MKSELGIVHTFATGREELGGDISWGEYSAESVYPTTGRAAVSHAPSAPAASVAKSKQSKRKVGSQAPPLGSFPFASTGYVVLG